MQPVTQRAIGVNVFFADETFISAGNSVKAAAAAFYRLALYHNAQGHAEHDDEEKSKC